MNQFTEYPLKKEKATKLFLIIMLCFCFLPVILNCVLISPLYMKLNADILFSNSAIIHILDYSMDFFDIIAFSVSYALIIFSVLLLSKKTARFIILLYTLAFALQIPLKIIMNIPLNGSLGSVEEIIIDVIYLSIYFILFMLQLFAVYLFAATDTNKYIRYMEFSKKKANKKNLTSAEEYSVMPFRKFFLKINPLQRSALKMSILIFLIRFISRLINDISYGAPESIGEVLIMAVYYLSDALYGIVAYIVALLVFSFVYERLAQKKTDEAIAPPVEHI